MENPRTEYLYYLMLHGLLRVRTRSGNQSSHPFDFHGMLHGTLHGTPGQAGQAGQAGQVAQAG